MNAKVEKVNAITPISDTAQSRREALIEKMQAGRIAFTESFIDGKTTGDVEVDFSQIVYPRPA